MKAQPLLINKTTKVFNTCKSITKKHPKNIFDTPAAEQALTSFGAGAANAGLRPVLIHQRIDFMIYTLDQIINWMMGLNILVLSVTGFFLVIGFLFLVTAIYSLIYDKAFRKKYLLKLSIIFLILLGIMIGLFYLSIKQGVLIL